MAPLNEDNTYVQVEEIAKRRNSFFSYFFHFDSDNLFQRKCAVSPKTVELKPYADSVKANDTMTGTVAFSNSFMDCSESTTNKTHGSKDSNLLTASAESCKSCELEQQKDNHMYLYKKRDSDKVSKQGSIRAALMDLSPQWFKSLIRDPEFLMTGGKKAEYNE